VLEFLGKQSGIVQFHLSKPLEGYDPLGWHMSGNSEIFWPGCDPWSFSMALGRTVVSSIYMQSKFGIPIWKKPFLGRVVASKIISHIRPMVPLMDHRLLPHIPIIQKHLKFLDWQHRSFSSDAAVALAYAIRNKDNIRLSLMLSKYISYNKHEDDFRWAGDSRFRIHDVSPREFLHSMIGDDAEYLIKIISKSTRRTHPLSANWIDKHFKFYPCELCHEEANMFILGATHNVAPCMLCVKKDLKAYAQGVRMLLKRKSSSSRTTNLFSAHSCINNCVSSIYEGGIGLKRLY